MPPSKPLLHAAALLLCLALTPAPAAGQTCGAIDALRRAAGTGLADDAPALAAMDADDAIGLIYLPGGARFLIATPLELRKPLFGERGAQLLVAAPLTLLSQPEHPLAPLFAVQPGGRVGFGPDTVRVHPEWFGAAGTGAADDSAAVQLAFDAAAAGGAAMLALQRHYGLGREVVFTPNATVAATPAARFTSVGGNPSGVTFVDGGYSFKNVLPHLAGFSGFCLRLLGADLGSFQLQTLSGCGDAVRLEMAVGAAPGADSSTVLDNTIWFHSITASRIGIAIRGGAGCAGAACVMQGNHILGRAIDGCAAPGLSAAVGWFGGSPPPAWDANQFELASVSPCPDNPGYRMWYAAPDTSTAREVLKVGSMGAVPPGAKLFEGYHMVLQGSIHLRAQQPEGAGALRGLASLVQWSGQTVPLAGHAPVRAATQPRSQAAFNGGRALLGNFFSIQAVPSSDWRPGEACKFYIYHQMATGELYQIKCDAARHPATGLPLVDCTQAQDNSAAGSGTPGEVELTLLNLSGGVISRLGGGVTFSLAIATLGSP